jgi:hypothetical protein
LVKHTIKGFEKRNLGFIYYKMADKPGDKNLLLAITTTDIPLIAYIDKTAVRSGDSSPCFTAYPSLTNTSKTLSALHGKYSTNLYSLSGKKKSPAIRGGIPMSGTIPASVVTVRSTTNGTVTHACIESTLRK